MPPIMATTAIGTFTKKIAPQRKCSSNQPPLIGPTATPTPTMAAQSPIALARRTGSVKMLVISPRVVGKITAAPTPMAARAAIELLRRIHLGRNGGCDREKYEASAQPATPAEAVAEAAGRQQQAGHDEGVRVDDPLQLRGVGVEFARQCGQCDVDDRGVDADDEDAEADDGKRGDRVIAEHGAGTHGQDSKAIR